MGIITRLLDHVGKIGFFGMMILVVANVILRKFATSISGANDYVQLFTAISVAAAIAFTAYERGNIEIEILMERFPKRVQNIMASIMMLITLSFFGIACWRLIKYAIVTKANREVTMTIYAPYYPFLYWIAVAMGIMMVVMIAQLIRLVMKSIHPQVEIAEESKEELAATVVAP